MRVIEQLTVEFGLIKPYPQTIINYDGDDDSGLKIVIDAVGPVTNLRINRTTGGEYLIINSSILTTITGSYLFDTIEISTQKGKKSAFLYRDGEVYNVLSAITSTRQWIRLEKGENKFTCTADYGLNKTKVYLQYHERINGV